MTRFLIICFSLISLQAQSCFILFLSDGTQVLVGNHEDWFAKDAAIKVNTPGHGKFGSVIFTFMSEGWAQGGMNEKGLFFDAAHTPYHDVEFDSTQERFPAYIWQAILDRCTSVEEALNFIRHYKLPELSESHIMLADATGHAVIIGVRNGHIAVKPFVQDYLMQTNFNPWHPELSDEAVCWRYEKAKNHLAITPVANLENMKSILRQTHQDSLTVYSNIYDLKNKVIYTYNRHDFSKAITVHLPEIFQIGNCISSLDSLNADSLYWKKCSASSKKAVTVTGKIIDAKTKTAIAYANIGLFEKNIGTLSDPDGSFELSIPGELSDDSIIFSSIGYIQRKLPAMRGFKDLTIELSTATQSLNEVSVTARKSHTKVARLGWMGGRDGVLPFDTIQGGGAIALLVDAPSAPVEIEKLQVRLMFNSKRELIFRLHFFSFDSVKQCPDEDLLTREILLRDDKRFGWLRFDLSEYKILLKEKKFLLGFEWIDDHVTRHTLLAGLSDWEKWKRDEFKAGNEKVERSLVKKPDGREVESYKYHGNMMNWPGFKDLPPFTGLMIQAGKNEKTFKLRTFARKTSMGKWEEISSTLNAVITVRY